MSKNLKHAKEATREVYLGDFVPYSGHVSDTVIKTIDGAYCKTWRIGGIPFETTNAEDLQIRHDAFNQMIRGMGDVSIWTHRVRREYTDRLNDDYANNFAKNVATRYYDSFTGNKMMTNETYFTIVYRPQLAKINTNPLMRLVTGASTRSTSKIKEDERAALKVMDELSHQVEAGLSPYEPFALGIYDEPSKTDNTKTIQFSETLTFYSFLLNGVWQKVGVQNTSIKNYLPHVRLFFGGEKLEIRTPDKQLFGAILDLKDYSDSSYAGVLNTLFYAPFPFVETQSFSILSKSEAKEALSRQQKQLIATADAAGSQIGEMYEALDQLIAGRFVMGEYHYSLAVFGDTPDETAKNLSYASTALNDAGFQAAMVDLVADAAWFAQLPANWKYRPRQAKITSLNFCGLSALHGFGSGKRDQNPWGEAVTILKTPNGAPYYFNWHSTQIDKDATDEKAPANTTIIGMTGSGKTVLELFLVAMSLKYKPTVVFFDKDRGAEIAIRALGGNYRVLKRGQPTGFNPFWLEPTEANIRFIESLIKVLIPRALTPSEDGKLSSAIRQTLKTGQVTEKNVIEDKSKRRLSIMCQMLPADDQQGGNMRDHLAKWCQGGALGWVLDNPSDKVDLTINTLFGFDDTDFLEDSEVLTPVTMYLLHCTETLIDGRRFMYVMAEFWKRLESPAFADFAVNKQYTIRKQNGFGIFDTQSPAQILKSPHVAAMVEQSATQIFLPNPKADYDDYVHGFKVTEAEYNIIRTLGESSRQFLVKQNNKSTIVKLDLGGMGDVLNILSSTADNNELLGEIMLEVGDKPEKWMPVFSAKLKERKALIGKGRLLK